MPAMLSRWARRRLRSRSPRMPTAGRSRAARSGRRRLRSPPSSGRAMKLASLKAGPDGQLVVVSRDLARCTPAEGIAPTLQAALESWAAAEPRLRALGDDLEAGRVAGQPFEEAGCASPLPRAYQWLDGSAYVTHVELVRRARGAELPERFWNDALLGQPNAGVDMTFDFARLIEHAATTRHLSAGTIIGSGTVANDAAREETSAIGSSCLAERRMLETLWHGAPKTPWLKFGDRVRIEMQDGGGRPIFGAIEQEVVRYLAPPA